MQAQVNIKGLNELLVKLKNFAPNIQNNVARGAIVGAALVIRDAARAASPVATRALRKNTHRLPESWTPECGGIQSPGESVDL